MRAAHNNARPSGGSGAAFLPCVRFIVERMHITGKGRVWLQVGESYSNVNFADQAAERIRSREALVVRVRPVVL